MRRNILPRSSASLGGFEGCTLRLIFLVSALNRHRGSQLCCAADVWLCTRTGCRAGNHQHRGAVQGITSIGDALEAQANSKNGRRLAEGQEAVEGLTLSLALTGESRESFGPKQVNLHAPLCPCVSAGHPLALPRQRTHSAVAERWCCSSPHTKHHHLRLVERTCQQMA